MLGVNSNEKDIDLILLDFINEYSMSLSMENMYILLLCK
jgi:hypothetical protein